MREKVRVGLKEVQGRALAGKLGRGGNDALLTPFEGGILKGGRETMYGSKLLD